MTSAFENLAGPGKPLRAEPPDKKEFEGLIRSGHARLRDALNTTLSLESRFDLAYNAAHALCLAALRRHGYRSTNRYIVFQLLPDTLNLGPATAFARSSSLRIARSKTVWSSGSSGRLKSNLSRNCWVIK